MMSAEKGWGHHSGTVRGIKVESMPMSALLVDGLHRLLTSENLKEVFLPFGRVLWAQVVTDAFERSLGFGYVVMENEHQASQALEALHGRMLAGRPLAITHTDVSRIRPSHRPEYS